MPSPLASRRKTPRALEFPRNRATRRTPASRDQITRFLRSVFFYETIRSRYRSSDTITPVNSILNDTGCEKFLESATLSQCNQRRGMKSLVLQTAAARTLGTHNDSRVMMRNYVCGNGEKFRWGTLGICFRATFYQSRFSCYKIPFWG